MTSKSDLSRILNETLCDKLYLTTSRINIGDGDLIFLNVGA